MRKALLIVLCLSLGILQVWAQMKTVAGKITDEGGNPVAGASIVVKGTRLGTVSKEDGSYLFSVPANSTSLVVSSLNFGSTELAITENGVVNVTLKSGGKDLQEVVVTALGISKSRRSLGYSPQTVKAADLEDKGDVNIINLLQGKVAGVEITGASGNAGSSSNIILRGMSSINGSNQALFVVDGIPISNDLDQTTNTLYGTQPANRALDINPNNIESMNILLGPAAAALYGSRASNGAIIITTKKGSGKKGAVSVTLNSGYSIQDAYGFAKLQNKYGQGTGGVFNATSTSSFGPAFGSTPTVANGLIATTATTVNGKVYAAGETIDYRAYADNIPNYFERGTLWDNSLSLNGGDAKNNFNLSVGRSDQKGIMPNTKFDKTNVQFSASAQLTDKLSLSGTATYFNTLQLGATQGNGGNSAMFGIWGVTRSTDLAYYKENYKLADGTNNWWVSGRDNPYFAAYENPINSNLKRTLGNIKLAYDLTSWLNVSYRAGVDGYTDSRKRIVAFSSTQATGGTGRVTEDIFTRSEVNGDLMITAKKNDLFLSGLNATLLVGQNINQRTYQNSYVTALSLTIPGFYNASNGTDFKSSGEYSSKRRLVGHYGQLSLGYKNYLFGEFTARADQSSTLPKENSTYLYYSASGSFVFTDAFKLNIPAITFGKVRASYARVGNDASVYKLENSFSSWSYGNNVASFAFPFGTTSGFGASSTIPNNQLTPEFTTSYEFGANVGLFKDRISFDVTYYNQTSTDQIIDVALPNSTGYNTRTINIGKIVNKGTEITLNLSPVRTKNFQWDISGNFTKNRNKVIELAPGITSMALPGNRFGGLQPSAMVGQPYGIILGSTIPRSPDGQFLIDSTTGAFAPAITNQVVANPNRDWTAGLTNTIRYKNFTLSAVVDYKKGGDILSWTVSTLRSNGSLYETGENRELPKILPGVIETVAGKSYVPNFIQIPAQTYWANLGGIGGSELTIFDATTFRIRELALSYDFRNVIKAVKSIKVTAFARNLFYYAPNIPIDPEVNTQGAGNIRGFELQSAPNTRNLGISLRANF